MNIEYLELLYDTVLGQVQDAYALPGAENLFEPGKPCDLHYRDAMSAYKRICQRLGISAEDNDLEQILHSMNAICRLIAFEMYRLGRKAPRDAVGDVEL